MRLIIKEKEIAEENKPKQPTESEEFTSKDGESENE
jgi:hypothetical protein